VRGAATWQHPSTSCRTRRLLGSTVTEMSCFSSEPEGMTGETPKTPLKWHAESFNNKFVELSPNFWSVSYKHHPGSQKMLPMINNRQYAFRVRGADGTEELLLFGVPGKGDLNDQEPANIAMAFAASLGLPIKRLICQGGLHMLYLNDWLEAMPSVTLYIPKDRIPFLPTGKAVIEKFGRGRILDLPKHGFPELQGTIEFLHFQGLKVHADIPQPSEGAKHLSVWSLPALAVKLKPVDPHDEVFAYHPASGLMIGADCVAWHFTKGTSVPFMFKLTGNKAGFLCCNDASVMAIRDKALLEADCNWILAKDFTQYVGFHELPGTACLIDAKALLRQGMKKVKWIPT